MPLKQSKYHFERRNTVSYGYTVHTNDTKWIFIIICFDFDWLINVWSYVVKALMHKKLVFPLFWTILSLYNLGIPLFSPLNKECILLVILFFVNCRLHFKFKWKKVSFQHAKLHFIQLKFSNSVLPNIPSYSAANK